MVVTVKSLVTHVLELTEIRHSERNRQQIAPFSFKMNSHCHWFPLVDKIKSDNTVCLSYQIKH